ncbi:MAG: hypothetical protein Q8942_09625 [Bacillota bacterium]|nr:hypothetical protein [Bacillota bacterium]
MIKRVSIVIILVLSLGIGGYFVFSSVYQKQTRLDNETTNLLIKTLKNPSLLKSINIADASHAANVWVPESSDEQKNIASKLVTYLDHASIYTSEIPKSNELITFGGNIGPSQLIVLNTNKSSIGICPAYYIITKNNSYSVKYIDGVVDVTNGNKHVYVKTDKLYNWLKNDEWKTDYKQM